MNNTYNIAMIIEYDGSNYSGFQKQKYSSNTIASHLEDAIYNFLKEKVDITVAGRTDAKVHALYQVINFKTKIKRAEASWLKGVNNFLPNDIVIKQVAFVEDNFNARYSAISRTYRYYLYNNENKSAILNKNIGYYKKPLDINLIKKSSKLLIGTKDFSSFKASNSQSKSPIKSISKIKIIRKKNLICFEITANSFLYHMVRNIIGAFIYVGIKKIDISSFKKFIEHKNRKLMPPTFMPNGLYLYYIKYKNNYFNYEPEDLFDLK